MLQVVVCVARKSIQFNYLLSNFWNSNYPFLLLLLLYRRIANVTLTT